MAKFTAVAQLGNTQIQIATENFIELFEAVAGAEELHEATEGENVRLIARTIKGDKGKGFKKYGYLRKKDGAILDLGMKSEDNALIPIFPYNRHSKDYKGFRSFKPDAENVSMQLGYSGKEDLVADSVEEFKNPTLSNTERLQLNSAIKGIKDKGKKEEAYLYLNGEVWTNEFKQWVSIIIGRAL